MILVFSKAKLVRNSIAKTDGLCDIDSTPTIFSEDYFMTSIFISYSRRDLNFANRIAAELLARNVDVYIDKEKLKAGNFAPQLGHEIETRNNFILIISPNSVKSKWVQAEVIWAFANDKEVIPLLLEDAKLTDMFFIAGLETVDCTRWNIDENIDIAIQRLAQLLKLSNDAIAEVSSLNELPIAEIKEDELVAEENAMLSFSKADITELFFTAIELAEEDPDRSLFLFERVLDLDPNHGSGNTRNLVEREKQRMIPVRIKQAIKAFNIGDWHKVINIADLILKHTNPHAQAQDLKSKATKNLKCKVHYEHAIIAAEKKKFKAVKRLITDITQTCREYGDPANLLTISNFPTNLSRRDTLNEHGFCVAFSPDGQLIAVGQSGNIKLYDLNLGKESILKGHQKQQAVHAIDFSRDGKYLISGSQDCTVKLWDVETRHILKTFEYHTQPVRGVTFSNDSRLIASVGQGGMIAVYSVQDRELIAESKAVVGNLYDVTYSHNDQNIIFSAKDEILISIDPTLEVKVFGNTKSDHKGAILSLSKSHSSDKNLLISGGEDGKIKIWDIGDRRKPTTLEGHMGLIRDVVFSPDDLLIASASDDGLVKLWDVEQQKLLIDLNNYEARVWGVAFSPNGKYLVCVGSKINIWEVEL